MKVSFGVIYYKFVKLIVLLLPTLLLMDITVSVMKDSMRMLPYVEELVMKHYT